ncbi:MAG: DUF2309 domain-containing protein [Candidatus Competibacter sp.]|nr:DUF2309 domain-containing protein [Candidatus Competibacter sp.]MDG4583239.1 DUF2309 domain-containing protein [Candidatus Competibacter sp.]
MSATVAPDRPSLGPRQIVEQAIAHLDHVLPGQAPILNFVHHNTLHGYQHLPFEQALAAAEQLTGIRAYLPEEHFRALYRTGRITDTDLDAAFARRAALETEAVLVRAGDRDIRRGEVLRVALVHGVEALPLSQLIWRIEEFDVTRRFQSDVPATVRQRLLAAAEREEIAGEARALESLWHACLHGLRLPDFDLHPEELEDLQINLAKSLLARFRADGMTENQGPVVHKRMQADALALIERSFAEIGEKSTFRGLLRVLTGQDLLDRVRPVLIRLCAAHLDEGLAAWPLPDRSEGLYAAWRRLAGSDLAWTFAGLSGWRAALARWPEQPLDAIVAELRRLGIPEPRWEAYLTRLALELPGWSGMMNWRQQHGAYPANRETPVALADYLALRLCLDGLWIEQLCREHWGLEGSLPALRDYFTARPAETLVRQALYEGRLPEYLASRARALVEGGMALSERGMERVGKATRAPWESLADMIWTWRHSPVATRPGTHTVHGSAWRLFRLAQHLGLSGGALRALSLPDLETLLAPLDELPATLRGALWQCAYEHHYRDELINALANNHGRWAARAQRPQAQIVFCIDDREEGIRRHLEELNPRIETLGAAGFFGVVMNWRGLDDREVTPLCPVVATPAHEVREVARPGAEARHALHDQRRDRRDRLRDLYHEIRRNLLSSAPLIAALAPGALLTLAGKLFAPSRQATLVTAIDALWVPAVPTQVAVTAADDGTPATPERPRLGFTDTEQADRVAALLRNIGLTTRFAPLTVLMGHGSISQNNPHLAAYDCGACSGRHGGPNARAFATMANRPAVRALLAERGIEVPEDTWFIGAEHNTCDELITLYDPGDLPAALAPALAELRRVLDQACERSAHERCRRFASAPRDPTPAQALRHVVERSRDFSQARPELGHATNAAALVGRRSMSQGLFLDRRAFLISYDPTQDPSGTVLEGILLAVGPVGAGINLEYYFSTVNNERLGCGTKTPHNVTGLFAVMEGASSDLRTGLPRQMIEIHEPLRLQIVVEASTEVLTAIYQRQPSLRELIGGDWVHVIAKDPDSGEFSIFDPARGFVPWAEPLRPLPERARSGDWYRGHTDPLSPALIGESEI